MEKRIIPSDTRAEKDILGSILINQNAMHSIVDMISDKDFYEPAHAKLYKVLAEMYEGNKSIDITTVASVLKDKKIPMTPVDLAELANGVAYAGNVKEYAKIISQKRIRRDLIRASMEIQEESFENDDTENVLEGAEKKIMGIGTTSRTYTFSHIKDAVKSSQEKIDKLQSGDHDAFGVTSGFKQLDHILGGFQKSDMVIIGARPSTGKTAITLEMGLAAARDGKSIAIFSLEMSKDQVMDRIISSESRLPLWKIRNGKLTPIDKPILDEALRRLEKMEIYIDDTPSPTVLQLRAMSRRLKMEHGLDMVIIDYVQLIQTGKGDSTVQQFTEISHGLKALGRELNIPVIALSQLNRAVDAREVKIPRLSDLRETGSWEQDADVVMFLYRPDRDKQSPAIDEINVAQIHVAKHRNGPLGVVNMMFEPELATFIEK